MKRDIGFIKNFLSLCLILTGVFFSEMSRAAVLVKVDQASNISGESRVIKTGYGEIISTGSCTLMPSAEGDQRVILTYSVCEEVESKDSRQTSLIKESSLFDFGAVSLSSNHQDFNLDSGEAYFVPVSFKLDPSVQKNINDKYGKYVNFSDDSDLYFSDDNTDLNGQNLVDEDSPISRCEMVRSKIQQSLESYHQRAKGHPCNQFI